MIDKTIANYYNENYKAYSSYIRRRVLMILRGVS